MRMRRLYVHGSGRVGVDAWPHQAASGGTFVTLPAASTVREQVGILSAEATGAVVFAHSIGAVPAVIAARNIHARGLVLVEPALYDIARGAAVIERHIGIVTEARAQADAGNLDGFWGMFRPLMFGASLDPRTWPDEQEVAANWATKNIPWGHGVRAEMITGIPTLVITGGWNPEYEHIAETLARTGARHVSIPGAQHRPQDLPAFATAVDEFEDSLPD